MNVATLFGAPLAIQPSTRIEWSNALKAAWIGLIGTPPGDIAADLDLMAPYFATGVSAKRLRSRIVDLPAYDDRASRLPEQILVAVDGQSLITPEGRILLDVLQHLDRTSEIVVDPGLQIAALDTAIRLRSRWQRSWIHKQFNASLSPSVLGAALFMAINGSVGLKNSLLLPRAERADRELSDVLLPLIGNFSKRLGGKMPESSDPLRSHWVFSQLTRLMARDIERSAVPAGSAIYIRIGRDRAVVDELANRLKSYPAATVHVAMTQMVNDYRSVRGKLSALGLMHEDPTTTRRIIGRFNDIESQW